MEDEGRIDCGDERNENNKKKKDCKHDNKSQWQFGRGYAVKEIDTSVPINEWTDK